jgi:hypothetical protein
MDSRLLLRIFSSWEMIAVCIFLILLLPLVFFIASTTSRPRIAPKAKKATPARKRPEKPAEGEPEEQEEPEDARRGSRGRALDDDQEEKA